MAHREEPPLFPVSYREASELHGSVDHEAALPEGSFPPWVGKRARPTRGWDFIPTGTP